MKEYRLRVTNYYTWKNFKGKGMEITVLCGKKETVVHGDGYAKLGKLVSKVNALVHGGGYEH